MSSEVLIGVRETGGGVHGDVRLLGQADQSNVITVSLGAAVTWVLQDVVNIEVLGYEGVRSGAACVLSQPDLQGTLRFLFNRN